MSDVVSLKNAVASKRQRDRKSSVAACAPSWLTQCLSDDRGRVLPNLANALIALRSAPETADAFGFDEMQQTAVLRHELPVAPEGTAAGGPFPRPARDADGSQLQEWLQHAGLPKIGREQVFQALDQRAEERRTHPVRDFLDGLAWNGQPRIGAWLRTYLGAADTEYIKGIGAFFLVAMVARVFQPGCKADYMLVLEGEQGAGKSRACRALAGEWFSDSLPDIHAKDAAQHLRGKWLIEIAELSATSKADAELLKAFISRAEEKYRPPYGRKEVTEPRQCVFIGTTNRHVYLKDETGARRFWPVKVGKIDIEELKRDRDQLLAEAVAHYRAGKQWWPDAKFEREQIKPEQALRFDGDPWEQTILNYVSNRTRVNISEIAREALHIETPKVGRADQNRISGVLAEAGWTSGRDDKGRFYQPPPVAP